MLSPREDFGHAQEEGQVHCNNHVVVPKDAEATPVMRTKHPQGVMMLGVVASDGKKMPPYFFPQGLKINTEVYLNVMRKVVKPWIDTNYPDCDSITDRNFQ